VRVAALYDIHGMLVPLEAVLAEVEKVRVDRIVVGGDIAAGPQPAETLERLRGLGDRVFWVRGNADRELAAPETAAEDSWPGIEWTCGRLDEGQRAFLGALPASQELEIDGLGRVLFCHATPRSDEEFVTPLTVERRLTEILSGVQVDVVVAGHTHIQQDRPAGAIRWVNPGSVGFPFEGEVAAFWAILGPDVELRATSFDIAKAVSVVRESGMPGAEEFVVENLLAAVGRDEAAEYFEARA
jgi:putative phosphoesterase